MLVLDGLEVLQGPDDARYGSFLDGDLRELLAALCQRDHLSLAVLTSRFAFADLDRFLGTAFHQLELHGLAPDNAARLLEELGVRGRPAEREHVSEGLDGHPLGLRVFADALPEEDRDEPRRFLDHSFHVGALPEGASLKAADALYRNRLENGKVFQWMPALVEGLSCALKDRRQTPHAS